ncbi:hypothetical protein A3F07_01210 [candidate division WWE3 bacterium RIFCSPHIGHO2_12_FULL_38_15]|uniref:Uncharacterized protein n=1 Tax=candidate division WWE3 bacterium RIFCSPHIGHO2_02_FULL_38_14 TaxID=1802620 RepID=A0A1F4V9A5_UNCKA|nr:MAG: hypothetical protein A2793_02085 [candidate division WWE3 bacterium RIFCSPHIGHO2_01_FULL_38_45]OGC48327.1 MAG: hypothetical protein A3F07_01210 [candidate division WWE3 bacterium RIFCSPHIGHO2_12_FULL_38_15]OGC53734.1 MAG: hypothetical protein A3D91_03815 [candidate division WWE3 bacterium RIFCSPHIGHO2_02_FULL_38_14]OGC54262.1 MAG: hypothetical protein A3B64_02010 [candidate division WWE3 bacterium RIFCSPLOWO2_01_FULL_37_24]HLB51505.1 hypothetical protein [Patescibacteria group bacterium
MFDLIPESISDTLKNQTSIGDILGLILNIMMGVSFSISLLSIAYAGILYVNSSGDPKNASRAWQGFLWGAITGMVTLGIFVIKNALVALLGVTNPNITNAVPNI